MKDAEPVQARRDGVATVVGNARPQVVAVGTRGRAVRRASRKVIERVESLGLELSVTATALAGRGDRAVRLQASRIRHLGCDRERPAAYRRLDRLMAQYGDARTGLDLDEELPDRFVCFIGQSRSGHSLVGSLVDAHPDAVLGHELHALKHLSAGFEFATVVRAARQNARIFHLYGREYTGYDYVVPGQHQGTCRRLIVAGDKKGNGTARLLARDPGLVDRLETRLPVPLQFVHVIRNPYDNIATKALRTGRGLEAVADRYLANARTIEALRAACPQRVHDLHLARLIAEPRKELSALIEALGLDPGVPSYLEACAGILFRTPSRTRDLVEWPPGLIDRIDTGLAEIPALAGYAGGFHDAAG